MIDLAAREIIICKFIFVIHYICFGGRIDYASYTFWWWQRQRRKTWKKCLSSRQRVLLPMLKNHTKDCRTTGTVRMSTLGLAKPLDRLLLCFR
jgi:hypothetical protein